MSTPNGWSDFFDDHAPRYEDNVFTHNTTAEVAFLVEVLGLQSGQSLLDVGCGTGRHSIALAGRGLAVTGIDVSVGMLTEARRRAAAAGVGVTWVQADATAFALEATFDAAICLCEGAFGLLGRGDDPIGQPLAILHNTAAALKPGAGCVFTVLNGFALARRYGPEDVAAGRFDPGTLTERSECALPEWPADSPLRERGFVPTELNLLFALAGLEVEHIYGGTAGRWGRRPVDLDEIEIMVLARKVAEPPPLPPALAGSRVGAPARGV